MTPTDIKAKEIAKDLFEQHYAILPSLMNGRENFARLASKLSCTRVITTLDSMKGLGKIHKARLWKLVLIEIEYVQP